MKRTILLLILVGAILSTSTVFATDRHVPSEYPTIQAGIDAAVNGDRVIIAQGTYTGADNRELDFGGRAITVQSEDPTDWDVVAGTVIDCQYGGRGFGFHSGETASSVLAGLTITNGYADFGGGIFCTGSSPTIRNCKLTDNIADYGGGMGNQNCSPTVTECMFVGNGVFYYGGGMYNSGCTLAVSNCIFTGNSADWGGGMENFDCSGAIVNCTFTGNSANMGGGMDNSSSAGLMVSNCILWEDTAAQGPEIYGTVSVSYSDVQGGYAGTGNINADPCFADAVGGDYHLLPGSACIDAGTNSPAGGLPATDIEGIPRPLDGDADGTAVADMGSYEFSFSEPVITLSETYFEFTAGLGGPDPNDQALYISNSGAGTLNWQITEGCEWLSVEPNSGSSTGEANEVGLSVDISGLAAGSYYCELTISDPCALNSPRTVDVNLTVAQPIIELSSQEFEFTALEGGPNPDDQILSVRNSGQGTLNWQITEGCEWLSAEPTSGISTGDVNEVTLSVDIWGLTRGTYDCQLLVSDSNAANSPQAVDVNLIVAGPLIELSALEFEFYAVEGGANPNDQILTVRNSGGGTLNWQISESCGWFSAEPTSGISAGEVNDVNLSVDISGLATGSYNCMLFVSDPNAGNSPQMVAVNLTVYPPWDTNSLVSLWQFEAGDGNTAYDSFGSNHGTIYGANWTTGMIGGALSFDGVDDIVGISPVPLSTSWTLSVWLRLSYDGGIQFNPIIGGPGTYRNFLHCRHHVDDIQLETNTEGDYVSVCSGVVNSSVGDWAHYAITRSGNTVSGYKNGIFVDEAVLPVGGDNTITNIGAGYSANYYEGAIDDVRIYNRALTEGEIWEVIRRGFTFPYIRVWPERLDFDADEGGPNPQAQILSIQNIGLGALNWEITMDCLWTTVEPNSGSSVGEVDEVTVTVDVNGLTSGKYGCNLTISDPCEENNPQMVSITLYVSDYDSILYVPSEYSTIQTAIDVAVDGDVVIVAPGTYTGAGNRDLDFGGKAITVRSADPEDPCVVAGTVIDCEGSPSDKHRGFRFHSGEGPNSVVAGFTIINGDAPHEQVYGGTRAAGGAISCDGASPTIARCTLSYNWARFGGCGGGICCWNGSSATITYCTITNNSTASSGGGIYCYQSNPKISYCTISDNSVPHNGGGICTVDGHPTIANCVVKGHTVYNDGAGIYCRGSATMNNCIIANNSADGDDIVGNGGGIYCYTDSNVAISDCTFTGNSAIGWDGIMGSGGNGGAIFCTGSSVTIGDCILWGNTATNNGPQIYGNSVVSYSNVEGGWFGEGNIDDDPCFASGPLGDYYLSQIAAGQGVNSSCVDAGSDTAANLGMDESTTRTDHVTDGGIVDMGFHYPAHPADIDGDGDVDFVDYGLFAAGWDPGNSMTIPRGSVVVDGNLDDWAGDVEWVALDKASYGNPNDVEEAWFSLQWDADANKVYAAVVVYDSDHVFLDEYVSWDASDRIEVFSQGDAEGGSGWTYIYDVAQHYMVGPNTAGGSWAAWGQGEAIEPNAGFEYAVSVSGDEIVYEVGVTQFDNYGGFSGGDTIVTDLGVGHVVRFDLAVDTRWSGGFGMLSENMMPAKFNNADSIARYMLVEEPGGPPCFERVADLDGNCIVDYNDLVILADNWLWGK